MTVFNNFEEKIKEIRNNPFYQEYLNLYKDRFECFSSENIPFSSYSEFMCYKEKGTRHEYERKYFDRRDRLVTSFILYLIYGDEKYYNMLLESLWTICGEVTWVVPAHLPMKDVRKFRRHIDLFSAETASYLAEIVYLIGDKLPEELKNLVVHEVTERVLDTYENDSFWWETLNSNWAAVCAGSVGMAYMQIAPERFEKVKERLLSTIDSYLDGYGDDGCCIEGTAYWEYGFGYFINFADMLYKFTDGKTDLLHSKKVENIAHYLQSVIMRKDILVSFSDSGREFDGINIGLYSYLRDTFGIQAPTIVKEIHNRYGSWCKLSFIVRNFMWSKPEHYESDTGVEKNFTKYYKDAQWYITRRKNYSFAAKCGHNGEEHNHNDVGSFILADDSGQLLVDLGCMQYTKENFGTQTRYTLLHNSSYGHSVPIIDGKAQMTGKEFFGTVINADADEFVLEMQNAYGVETGKITRNFCMLDNGVRLTDSFGNSGEKIKERFVSLIEPQIISNGLKIGNAILICEESPIISSQCITSHSCKEVKVYLIDFNVREYNFQIEILLENS